MWVCRYDMALLLFLCSTSCVLPVYFLCSSCGRHLPGHNNPLSTDVSSTSRLDSHLAELSTNVNSRWHQQNKCHHVIGFRVKVGPKKDKMHLTLINFCKSNSFSMLIQPPRWHRSILTTFETWWPFSGPFFSLMPWPFPMSLRTLPLKGASLKSIMGFNPGLRPAHTQSTNAYGKVSQWLLFTGYRLG